MVLNQLLHNRAFENRHAINHLFFISVRAINNASVGVLVNFHHRQLKPSGYCRDTLPGVLLHGDTFCPPALLRPVLELARIQHLGEALGRRRILEILHEGRHLGLEVCQGLEVGGIHHQHETAIVVAALGIDAEPQPGKQRGESLDREGEARSEEHTSELQSLRHLVCRLLLEKKKKIKKKNNKRNENK